MIVFIPVPAKVTALMSGVQEQKMKAVRDERSFLIAIRLTAATD